MQSVFFAVSSTAWRKRLNERIAWKGTVGRNKQQVQKSVREDIKPETTKSGGN